jgi:molybdopterin synthase catalytic subunit
MFRLVRVPLDPGALGEALARPGYGALVAFAGRVRDHNLGRRVLRLEYEAYEALALREGERIVRQVEEEFRVAAICHHRLGLLEVGETAVWVGAAAPHRREAFLACSRLLDEVKRSVPIWKREHYDGAVEWIHGGACCGTTLEEPSL